MRAPVTTRRAEPKCTNPSTIRVLKCSRPDSDPFIPEFDYVHGENALFSRPAKADATRQQPPHCQYQLLQILIIIHTNRKGIIPMSAFESSACPTDTKLDHFSKYVRRQRIARVLVQYEMFKLVLGIKGSIIECGVHHGSGLMTWAKLSTTLEPYNYWRKIIGFDTFKGFPAVHGLDGTARSVRAGMFRENYDIVSELQTCISEYDANRFLNHIDKVELVQGDAIETIPEYVGNNPHLLVSLLYLDFDIYEPTVAALDHLRSRIPRGGIVAFDEVNNSEWPGETRALLETFNLNHYNLQCFPFEPNISFIQL